jgi:hypothetical protein
MKRTICDSVTAMLKGIFGAVRCESVPMSEKIDSARMSHTRLKALDKPVCPEQVQESSRIENLSRTKTRSRKIAQDNRSLVTRAEEVADAAFRSGEVPTLSSNPRLASVSHYRLASYAAKVAEEEAAKAM